MPVSIHEAVRFLETQWSSINDNKIKGILAEVRLKSFLLANETHFGPGGWIVIPGKPVNNSTPTRNKVCLIPRMWNFSWQNDPKGRVGLYPAEISAYNFFRQLGVEAYFVEPVCPDENKFELPQPSRSSKIPAKYPRSYDLELNKVRPDGRLQSVSKNLVFDSFPTRNGLRGLKCNAVGRVNVATLPWSDAETVSELFWFEYARYYFQVDYLLSNNDLDMYLIGESGSTYPVELKSKAPARDDQMGEWFGIDMGPFAKLAFFTANAMNTDALYIVEEVDASGKFVNWLAIRYTELVKTCSWVGRGGGAGMTGGASTTYKVPKAAFTPLAKMLPAL